MMHFFEWENRGLDIPTRPLSRCRTQCIGPVGKMSREVADDRDRKEKSGPSRTRAKPPHRPRYFAMLIGPVVAWLSRPPANR